MKVCFLGTGSIGQRHILNLKEIIKDPLIVHAVRSSTGPLPVSLEKIISRTFFSCAEADSDYDAVFITNPTFLHYQTLLEMQHKGKFFFVEKPLFASVQHDLGSISTAVKNVYVACPIRYTSVICFAKSIADKEKILSARAICSSYLPEWRKNTDYRNSYSAHKEQGGGVMLDIIHEWDYLSDLLGFPQNVSCFHGKCSDLEIDSDDFAVYIAEYANCTLELHLDYYGRYPQRYLEIITNEHLWKFDILNQAVFCDGSAIITYNEDANQKYLSEMHTFLNIMRNNQLNPNTLEHAYHVMKLALCE